MSETRRIRQPEALLCMGALQYLDELSRAFVEVRGANRPLATLTIRTMNFSSRFALDHPIVIEALTDSEDSAGLYEAVAKNVPLVPSPDLISRMSKHMKRMLGLQKFSEGMLWSLGGAMSASIVHEAMIHARPGSLEGDNKKEDADLDKQIDLVFLCLVSSLTLCWKMLLWRSGLDGTWQYRSPAHGIVEAYKPKVPMVRADPKGERDVLRPGWLFDLKENKDAEAPLKEGIAKLLEKRSSKVIKDIYSIFTGAEINWPFEFHPDEGFEAGFPGGHKPFIDQERDAGSIKCLHRSVIGKVKSVDFNERTISLYIGIGKFIEIDLDSGQGRDMMKLINSGRETVELTMEATHVMRSSSAEDPFILEMYEVSPSDYRKTLIDLEFSLASEDPGTARLVHEFSSRFHQRMQRWGLRGVEARVDAGEITISREGKKISVGIHSREMVSISGNLDAAFDTWMLPLLNNESNCSKLQQCTKKEQSLEVVK